MTVFRYRALTRDGRPDSGTLEAADRQDATRRLAARGLIVTEVEEKTAAARVERRRRLRLRRDDVVALLREWATLLSAGLTIDDALAVCASGGKPPKVLEAVGTIRRAIRDGRPFHVALADTGFLPQEAVVLVEAGEAAGALPRVLERLADDFTERRTTHEGLVTALLYPAVLLVTTFIALGIIVLVVAPNLAELFESARSAPPPRIATLLAFSSLIKAGTPVALLALGAAIAGLALMSRDERLRRARDAQLLRLPFLGDILRSTDSARFASAGALMIHCGVVPTRALPLAAATMANAHLRQAISGAVAEAARGAPLQEALARSRALPLDLLSLIGAGLRTGRLADVLHHGGALHAARARAKIQRFGALLTPAITVFAGVVVGALAYLVLTAVVSLNEVALQ